MRLLLVWSFIFLISSPAYSDTAQSIQSLHDIQRYIQSHSYDIKLLQQNILKSQAALNNLKGTYYHPTLRTSGEYKDDQQQPTNPFQPAQTQSANWDVNLEQKTPWGVDLNVGSGNKWTKFFQAEPSNPLLPYPQSFNEPVIYLEANVDLIHNLFGYTTRKQLETARLDLDISRLNKNVLERKIFTSAASLYVQIMITNNLQTITNNIIQTFTKLREDLQTKSQKSLAEYSDMYKLNALIQARKADLFNLKKTERTLKVNFQNLLGLSGPITIEPVENLGLLLKQMKSCETAILQSPFSRASTQEIFIAEKQKIKSSLQSKIYKVRKLPEVSLTGSMTATGTDNSFSSGYNEVIQVDRPIYSIGLNMSWPLSPLRGKASSQAAEAEDYTGRLHFQKILNEKQNLWTSGQSQIQWIRQEHASVYEALNNSEKQIKELLKQFEQGRLSLFQLTEEEIQNLQTKIRSYNVMNARFSTVLGVLQEFDSFSCSLTH